MLYGLVSLECAFWVALLRIVHLCSGAVSMAAFAKVGEEDGDMFVASGSMISLER